MAIVKKLTDKSFRYRSAEDSRKPGYLARRFRQIRREQEAASKKPNVHQIIKKKAEAK